VALLASGCTTGFEPALTAFTGRDIDQVMLRTPCICPRWGSNPHWAGFKSASSAHWDTGACYAGALTRIGSAHPYNQASPGIRLPNGSDALAAGLGVEPRSTASEAVHLPLVYPAKTRVPLFERVTHNLPDSGDKNRTCLAMLMRHRSSPELYSASTQGGVRTLTTEVSSF
jgi:hypothetical protein